MPLSTETPKETLVVRVAEVNKTFPYTMSAAAAARFIGVSRPTLVRMIERFEISAHKSRSGHWRVITTSICKFMGLEYDVDVVE